jgi:hypothetical protein
LRTRSLTASSLPIVAACRAEVAYRLDLFSRLCRHCCWFNDNYWRQQWKENNDGIILGTRRGNIVIAELQLRVTTAHNEREDEGNPFHDFFLVLDNCTGAIRMPDKIIEIFTTWGVACEKVHQNEDTLFLCFSSPVLPDVRSRIFFPFSVCSFHTFYSPIHRTR